MADARPMLGDVELQLVQNIEADEDQVLIRHDVPALEGDFLQGLGRRATRLILTGVLTGPEAGEGLKTLRDKFRAAQPVDFVADITTATRVGQVLIEEMGVRELAGKPQRFEYAFTLREYIPAEEVITEEPPEPEPPDDPADDIDDNVGTLIVEVVVEGRPNFDSGQVTVTVQGTTQDGNELSRTLANREDNVWTEEGVPVSQGEYAVTAAVTGPEPLTGSATTAIQAGQQARVTIRLTPGSLIATIFSVHFRFDKSFIEPCMRAVMQQVAGFAEANGQRKMLIVGHTDLTGSRTYNQSLSERRARSAYAYLTFGNSEAEADAAVVEWNSLRQSRPTGQATSERDTWGVREYQHMLQALGFYPGRVDGDHGGLTDEAVEAFRRQAGLPPGSTVDDPAWEALIRAYLAQNSLKVSPSQLLPNCDDEPLRWLGCGEDDPAKNVGTAWRPNRRTEFLFISAQTLPCEIVIPDTFTLPAADTGVAGNTWCLDQGNASSRCCFVVPAKELDPCPQNGQNRWCRPPRPPRFTLNGTIKREVRLPDGTIRLDPAPQQKFVLIAPDGEFKQSERSDGEANPAKTDSNGAFSFQDMPPGIFTFEVIQQPGSVLVRLEDEGAETATGNVVCKEIRSGQETLDVVILAAPALRQITLPVVAHLMTARDGDTVLHGTTRDKANVEQLLEQVNQIWQQARVQFELQEVVEAIYEPPTPVQPFVNQGEFFFILANCAFPNVINLFFVQDIEDPTAYFVAAPGSGATTPGIAIEDLSTDQLSTEFTAQALGNFLNLPLLTDPTTLDRLMHEGLVRTGTVISDSEVDAARASEATLLEHTPLDVTVAGGATQIGGSHSATYVVLRDSAAGPVTVEAQIPPALLATGTATMTGGDPVPGFPLRRNVGRSATGRTAVEATFTAPVTRPTGTTMHTYQDHADIYVVDFSVNVDGAQRLGAPGSNIFVAQQDPTGVVTITAEVGPESALPRCTPSDVVQWSGGDPVPGNPFQRTVSKSEAGQTDVSVTFAGLARTFDIRIFDLAFVRDQDPFDEEIDPVNWTEAFRLRADLPGETRDEITIEITSYLIKR